VLKPPQTKINKCLSIVLNDISILRRKNELPMDKPATVRKSSEEHTAQL
jgi:hypothetical protein